MKKLNIAVIGLGQVGQAFLEGLKSEYPLQLVAVCDHNTDKKEHNHGAEFVDDYREVIKSQNVDVVVETIGGTGVAYDVVTESLAAGKHVVTANTALLATQGHRLLKQASAVNGHLKFEAALHGDAAWARYVGHQSTFNGVQQVYGIFSACANYVLMRMAEKGESIEKAYEAACEFGFGCGDFQYDLGGREALYRAMILRALAFGVWPKKQQVDAQGLQGIEPIDIQLAGRLGYRIKLLARVSEELQDVAPYLVEADSFLGHTHGNMLGLAIDNEKGGTFMSAVDEGVQTAVHGLLGDLLSIAAHEKPHDVIPQIKGNYKPRDEQLYFVRYDYEHWDSSKWPHTIEMREDVSVENWAGAVVQTRLTESEIRQTMGTQEVQIIKLWKA